MSPNDLTVEDIRDLRVAVEMALKSMDMLWKMEAVIERILDCEDLDNILELALVEWNSADDGIADIVQCALDEIIEDAERRQ